MGRAQPHILGKMRYLKDTRKGLIDLCLTRPLWISSTELDNARKAAIRVFRLGSYGMLSSVQNTVQQVDDTQSRREATASGAPGARHLGLFQIPVSLPLE